MRIKLKFQSQERFLFFTANLTGIQIGILIEYLKNLKIEVECPKPVNLPYPGSLDEAMPENIYNKFILKIPDEVNKFKSYFVYKF